MLHMRKCGMVKNCSNCGRYKKNCFYLNIKRLAEEKQQFCPYWTPVFPQPNLKEKVIAKLIKHG